jgi:flotillin
MWDSIKEILSGLTIPFVIVVLFGVFFGIFRAVSKLYNKVPPNVVAVVFGRKKKTTVPGENPGDAAVTVERGYRVVKGGGFMRIPILEDVKELSLNTIPLSLEVQAPSKDKVLVKVKAIGNVKILSDDASLALAIERFLGKDEAFIKDTAKQNLDGVLRGIIATLTVEGLIGDRKEFETNALEIGNGSLGRLGLTIDLLTIQDVTDAEGYIESLGKKRTSEVVADAKIGEAVAKRRGDVESATASREGAVATAQAQQAISDAERDRDMQIADNQARVGAQEARVPIAAQIAATEEGQKLKVAGVQSERAEAEAQIDLQGVIKRRTEATLDATVVVEATKRGEAAVVSANKEGEAAVVVAQKRGEAAVAEATRKGEATVAQANAEQQAASMRGEATRVIAEKEAAGNLAKQNAEADGRMRLAQAQQAEMEAEAAGTRAQGLAAADVVQAGLEARATGTRAQGLSDADVTKARLMAEAEGIDARAQALAKLDDTGRLLMILEALPPVITAVGGVAKEIMVPVSQAIGTGLGNIDEVRIIDMGQGGQAGDGNVLKQFIGMPTETIFGLIERAKAMGFGDQIKAMAKKFGLDAALLDNPTKEGIDNAKSTLAGAVAATDAGTTKA